MMAQKRIQNASLPPAGGKPEDDNQRAQAALRERVKELTCLYSLAKLAERPGISLEGIIKGVVELIPPAWQYPEVTAARITVDGNIFETPNYAEGLQCQTCKIIVNKELRGIIEIAYTEKRPELDEGPFLHEERNLINALAYQIAIIIERRQAAAAQEQLQEQLRHADRLATIGQLAAGVAHELNEPLGNILGFAQLAQKQPGLDGQVAQDIEKIVATSLHAREVVRKLMLFARQMPPNKTPIDLNKLLEEGLLLLEARCASSGIAVRREFAADLPEVTADPSQLHQVLVNLIVNAIQAMPDGGTLTIGTKFVDKSIVLFVEDTGVGMTKEIQKQIFIPFFTTKDVNEGTGLGLPVIHGIVISHDATITVDSVPGRGSRFEITLPITAEGSSEE